MDPLDKQKIWDIFAGDAELLPLVHGLASAKYGRIYIEWLHQNKIFGNKLKSFFYECGSNPSLVKEFILKRAQIKYMPTDLVG